MTSYGPMSVQYNSRATEGSAVEKWVNHLNPNQGMSNFSCISAK